LLLPNAVVTVAPMIAREVEAAADLEPYETTTGTTTGRSDGGRNGH
jgi:hypothetical protein